MNLEERRLYMSKLKRLTMATLSTSILLTQGGPLPYLAYAMDSADRVPINGEVNFSWMTSDQVTVGSTFNPYEGLKVIDADGDNVAVLATVSGEVDTSRIGSYPITYSIENVDGETFTITRQVEVVAAEQHSDEMVALPTDTQIEEVEQDTEIESEEKLTEGVETVSDEELGENTLSQSLNDVNWMLYNRSDKEELVKFKVNVETGKYEVYLGTNLDEKLVSLDDERLNKKIVDLSIFSSQQVEKVSLSLTLKDLLTESDEVKALMDLSYELGDQISVIPLIKEKNILVVNGITGGDISIEQEDYSDGVESEDLIHNVRFVLDEAGLLTLYNEAPTIEGIEDIVVPDLESFDPLSGVVVNDDYDENLISRLETTIEMTDEVTQKIIYRVTDSWGRTTEAIRYIVEAPNIKYSNDPLTEGIVDRTTQTNLTNNTIEVHGVSYENDGSNTLRMKITFNQQKRRLYVTEQDGYRFNSRIEGTYFKMILFSSSGQIKNEIEVLGTDKSNDSKLDELVQSGWRFEYGDRLFVWHYQSDSKLKIQGTVQESGDIDFTTGLPSNQLMSTRFELLSTGLKRITNNPPTITFDENTVTVPRGNRVDLFEGIVGLTDTDEEGGDIRVVITNQEGKQITTLDTSILGEQIVTYTVRDEWGLTSTATRTYNVVPKNEIETTEIQILSNNSPMMKIGFDEINYRLRAELMSDGTQAFTDSSMEADVILTVYTSSGKVRRSFTIPADGSKAADVINTINNSAYKQGDYINITSTTPNRIRIKGNITNKPEHLDYANNTVDVDYLQNVRFELSSDGQFKYVYNEAPQFNSIGELSVIRGENFSYTEGISIEDDHDGTIELTDEMVKIQILSGDPSQVGEVKYTITYTDSWGRSSQFTRTLVVNPPTTLELSQIQLVKEEDKNFLTIGFDEVTHRLKVISYAQNDWISGNESDTAFELKLYGSNKEVKNTVTLKFQTEVTQAFIQQIEAIEYSEGDYITVVVHDHTKLNIVETPDKEVKLNSEDEMLHSRLELTTDGLNVIYNKAPEIKGVDDVKVVYGNTFNNKDGVTVDDEDINLDVTVEGVIDTNQLGNQTLTYKVTDSYGRTTTVIRNVTVVPVYTTNEVQYTDENNQYLVSIGINESATGFTGTITDLSNSTTKSQDEMVTQDGNLDVPNDTLFKFTVYNETGNRVSVLEITESTIINDSLFDELKALVVRPGYCFSVEAQDLTKVKVTGRLEKDTQVGSIDYDSLTEDNRDKVENVRFELTENIVEVIYNQAPVITIEPTLVDSEESSMITLTETSTDITRNKALTKEAYNLLEGVTVTDDKDDLTLTVDNVEVDAPMLVSELNQSVATIGETYTVTYHVEDSWGRLSEPVERQVTITSAMNDVDIIMYHQPRGIDTPNNKAVTIDINFDENNSGQWVINRDSSVSDSDKIEGNNFPAYAMVVTSKDGTEQFNYLFGDYQESILPGLQEKYTQNVNAMSAVENALNTLNTVARLEYGTIIQFRSWKEEFLVINGTIIDAKEDYSRGATIDEYLMNSKFIVSPEGLRQVYEPQEFADGNQRITWYNGINGLKEFSLVFNPTDKTITFEQETDQVYDLRASGTYAFKIKFHKKDGTELEYTAAGGNGVTGSQYRPAHFANWLTQNNINSYENIEYIQLTPREARMRNLRIEGNISYQQMTKEDNDFSQGAVDMDYFTNVRFYFNDTGIEAVYNKAPVFEGIEDTDIIVDTEFNVNEGVGVTDAIDDYINSELTYSVNPESIETEEVNQHTLTYSVTDSWGRETEEERIINVRPELFDNKIQVYSSTTTTDPAFEIIFDNQKEPQNQENSRSDGSTSNRLGGLDVKSYTDEPLDLSLAAEDIFKIWVFDSTGNQKAQVTLLGRDTATSSKLNVLETIDYCEGDVIKVWRHPGVNNGSEAQVQTLKITGTITNENNASDDYSDGFDNLDQMNNTVFIISNEGLSSQYNEAPTFENLNDLTLYYGDTFEPLKGISVTDDKDSNLNLTESDVTHNFQSNRIGTYTATYTITDSWGRTTSKTITVKVLSKVTKNTFEIYQNDATTKSTQKLVTIGFNEDANRFVIDPDSSVSSNVSDLTVVNDTVDSSNYSFEFTIYNRYGAVKYQLQLNSLTDSSQFRELENVSVENGDMIAIISKDPSNVHVTENVVNNTHNYETGFESTEQMKTVRFKVTTDGLEEVKQQSMTINGTDTPITTKRTVEPDFLDGIVVKHPNEEILSSKIQVSGYDLKKVGQQTITYTVTDSWGATTTASRTLIIEPYNELEKVSVKLKGTTPLTVGFDAVEKKLTTDLTTTSTFRDILERLFNLSSLPTDTPVMEVAIFSESGAEKEKVTLMATDLTEDSDKITQIKEFSFEYGDYLGVNVYEYSSDVLEMSGPIKQPKMRFDSYSMDAVRYEITENGLRLEYNDAPSITLTTDSHFIGEYVDFDDCVELNDDKDSADDLFLSFTSQDYDEYSLGKYTITATVTDSWNRTTTEDFDFYITSYLEESTITLQNDKEETLVTLDFDSREQKLKWNFYEEVTNPFITSTSTTKTTDNSTDDETNAPTEESLLFKLHIYSDSGQALTTINISNEDTATSLKEKLDNYLNYEYHYNYFINIEIIDNKALDCIRISEVDTSLVPNLEASSDDSDKDNEFKGNYNEKLENADYYTHVRFELDPYGLIAIYNEAPVLENTGDKELTLIKNIDVNTYGLLNDIKVSDDHDYIDIGTIKILYNNSNEKSNLRLGENTISYIAVDSWGRQSEPITRKLNLLTAMNDISIEMYYQENATAAKEHQVLDIKFAMNETESSEETKSDMSDGQLIVANPNSETNNQFIKPLGGLTYPAYAIRISNENSDVKYQKFLGGTAGTQFQQDCTDFGGQKTNTVSEVVNDLNNLKISYGDKIELRTYAAGYLVINGQIVNAQEEYSEGAYINDILTKSYFKVTENGLEQVYENNTTAAEGTNKLVWLSGAAGTSTVELIMNHQTHTFAANVLVDQRFDVTSADNEVVFKLDLYRPSQSDQPIKSYSAMGGPGGTKASDFADEVSTWTFEEGDYLRIWVKPTLKNNIRLYGDANRIGVPDEVDYTNTISNLDYYNEAYFYFDPDGSSRDVHSLTIFYNQAPKFTGLDDIILLKDRSADNSINFTVDLKEGVVVHDEDNDIGYVIKDSNGSEISNPEGYVINSLGIQRITYEATDSLGRTTSETRFIWVQQESEISINDGSKLIVQQSNPTLQSEEARLKYLRELVTVTDKEDMEQGVTPEIKDNDITGMFDVDRPGEYPIQYRYQDLDGNVTTLNITITVVRTISVSVPRNNIPFQVVTNLLGETTEGQEFISGTIKVVNNYVTDVNMSVKSLSISTDQPTKDGEFTLVDPTTVSDWEALSEEETMTKMSLGLYAKSGINTPTNGTVPTKDSPVWLTTSMSKTLIGVLPKGTLNGSTTLDGSTTVITPSEAVLSFTAKYGKNFTSGKHRMKFTMVLEFE